MAVETLLTAQQAARQLPDGRWELVRGEVAEMTPVGALHGRTVQKVGSAVESFVGGADQALMGPEIGFLVARDPDTLRAPDWSLTWNEVAERRLVGPWIEGGPNLAVEVVTSEESWTQVEEKVADYLAAGTQLVWVINCDARRITVFRPDAPVQTLREADTLGGEPVLAGFEVSVSDVLPLFPAGDECTDG